MNVPSVISHHFRHFLASVFMAKVPLKVPVVQVRSPASWHRARKIAGIASGSYTLPAMATKACSFGNVPETNRALDPAGDASHDLLVREVVIWLSGRCIGWNIRVIPVVGWTSGASWSNGSHFAGIGIGRIEFRTILSLKGRRINDCWNEFLNLKIWNFFKTSESKNFRRTNEVLFARKFLLATSASLK
jgi:hypothetical protein